MKKVLIVNTANGSLPIDLPAGTVFGPEAGALVVRIPGAEPRSFPLAQIVDWKVETMKTGGEKIKAAVDLALQRVSDARQSVIDAVLGLDGDLTSALDGYVWQIERLNDAKKALGRYEKGQEIAARYRAKQEAKAAAEKAAAEAKPVPSAKTKKTKAA